MNPSEMTNVTPGGRGMPWRWPLHYQILLGLILGGVLGYLTATAGLSATSADVAQYKSDRTAMAERIELAGLDDVSLAQLEAAAQAGDRSFEDELAYEQALADRSAMDQQLAEPTPAIGWVEAHWTYLIYDLLGDLFINGLKLIIVPLVVSSIILAVASIGAQSGFGRLGGKTLGYYLATSLMAIVIGLALVNVIKPGAGSGGIGILVDQDLSAFAGEQAAVAGKAQGKDAASFLDVFRKMVPANVVSAAAEGQLLGLIVVSLLVGYFATRVLARSRDAVLALTQGVYDITLRVTDLILRLAPIGVCFLIASTVAVQYAKLAPDDRFDEFLTGIVVFAATALGALLIHFLVVMPLILCLIARVNPVRHYRAMLPALLTAFSTASSSATLPVTMECVEDRAKVSRKTVSFVLPLGATVNMDGTALYECVACMFICQAFGIDLTIGQQFFVVVVALLTSIGVAGVPSASIVAIVLILEAISGQPAVRSQLDAMGVASLTVGLGLIWLFDRPLDMCRTAVNIFSDSVGAVVIARTEGETGILADTTPL